MTDALAAAAVAVWLAGVIGIAAFMPRAIREEPVAQLAADLAPVAMCAVMATITVAWPALPVAALLTKLTDRRKP